MNIEKSKKINSARLRKMVERNECLEKVKVTMIERLAEERKRNHGRYMNTVKKCIVQSMIKLLEPSLKILCRKEDESALSGSLSQLE